MESPCRFRQNLSLKTKLTEGRGGEGMRFSLQTREIIADSIETITCAQFHDANISIPGCDKNMPGVVVSVASIGLSS
jgi:dihydroxyacid dehydratase/phosphogluconate dehydratase